MSRKATFFAKKLKKYAISVAKIKKMLYNINEIFKYIT